MQLKKFTPADRTDFLEMCYDFYNTGAVLKPIPMAQMERTFDKAVAASPHVMGFLMDEDGQTAGYGLIYPFYSNEAGGLCLMLEEIYVKPDFRGRGLGTQYLKQIAGAVGPDVIGLKLEICPSNERARKLYESMGFSTLGYESMIKPL